MKLYTEEQVRGAMQEARYAFSSEKGYDEILKSLSPIELPSDEEIEEESREKAKKIEAPIVQFISAYYFIMGAKWMREQILNQNK